jgi:hypothetical protein
MTIVFSAASSDLIVMTVDSAVTNVFSDHYEYKCNPGRKSRCYPGGGCVATWGTLAGNEVWYFLNERLTGPSIRSVNELRVLVNQYLVEEYRPRELGIDDVGYHVAGFDPEGCPRLFHIFWGYDRPRPPGQVEPEYHNYDQSSHIFLYNGRNDLVDIVVRKLLKEIEQGKETRFDIETPVDLIRLGDFVARFAAELTPQVRPPFLIYLVSPQNEIAVIENKTLCPIDQEDIKDKLKSLGVPFDIV